MTRIIHSLYSRIALALLGLLVFVGAVQLMVALVSSQRHEAEVTQRLNLDLAKNLVERDVLLVDGEINERALEGVFDTLMLINPSIECYLIDLEGTIVTHSQLPGPLVRRQIAMDPVNRMMVPEPELPILGDDPLHADRSKPFTFAPLMVEDSYWGYLYIVLASQDRETVAATLAGSQILRMSLGVGAAALVAALAAGLFIFNLLTRRLRRLTAAVETYRAHDFGEQGPDIGSLADSPDEIGVLARAFDQMSDRIADQVRKLRQTDELRRELIANVSHDLRTPLATLTGYLETLELKDEQMDAEERRRFTSVATRQGERLRTLVGELFELARLESSQMKAEIEPFPLAELLQDVVQDFQLKARESGVDLTLELPSDAPLVAADIGLIQRVLQNLIGNALKHTEDGGSVTLTLDPSPDRVAVRVTDTGCGIPEKELERVFDRFYQAPQGDGAPRATGGLGLAIVRKILDLHGSAIHAASEVGRGTVFSFSLPAAS
jgi:two-component system OmpR family sensor kinase